MVVNSGRVEDYGVIVIIYVGDGVVLYVDGIG